MKRTCKHLMRNPGNLNGLALVFIVLAVFSVNVVPIIAINAFIIGGLVFLIEAVLYLKLGLIDTWSYIAAIAAFLAAFAEYTRL